MRELAMQNCGNKKKTKEKRIECAKLQFQGPWVRRGGASEVNRGGGPGRGAGPPCPAVFHLSEPSAPFIPHNKRCPRAALRLRGKGMSAWR